MALVKFWEGNYFLAQTKVLFLNLNGLPVHLLDPDIVYQYNCLTQFT